VPGALEHRDHGRLVEPAKTRSPPTSGRRRHPR
jgi:hypothetical protein